MIIIFFFNSHQNHIYYDPSSEPSRQDGSDEGSQLMFLCRITKKYSLLS